MADDPILEWANDIYTPGEATADLEPDPNFDPDAEIDLHPPLMYPGYDSDAEASDYGSEDEARVQEWTDDVPGDAGSGEDPFTFQGDPYMNEEMDRFLENQEMGPPQNYF